MTAIGFLLILFALASYKVLCDPYNDKPIDYIPILSLWVGAMLVIAGITIKLYEIMP